MADCNKDEDIGEGNFDDQAKEYFGNYFEDVEVPTAYDPQQRYFGWLDEVTRRHPRNVEGNVDTDEVYEIGTKEGAARVDEYVRLKKMREEAEKHAEWYKKIRDDEYISFLGRKAREKIIEEEKRRAELEDRKAEEAEQERKWRKIIREREERKERLRPLLEEEAAYFVKCQAKLRQGLPLSQCERNFIKYKGYKAIDPDLVEIPIVKILDGCVNGDFTLRDIHFARDGPCAAEAKDSSQLSMLQLLDEYLENMKKNMNETLNIKDRSFFDSDDIANFRELNAEQRKEAIRAASTGIQCMLHGEQTITDCIARQSCESWTIACAEIEVERKLILLNESIRRKEEGKRRQENAAEAAAASGVFSGAHFEDIGQDLTDEHLSLHTSLDSTLGSNKTGKSIHKSIHESMHEPIHDSRLNFGFDITNQTFDLTFVPNDDPNVYKPIEIISYIGLTKNVSS